MGKEDIEFTAVTEDFGNSYKAFLKRYKNFGPSQTNKCLCWLSKLVYLAVDYEILRANPLEDMEYEKKPAPKHRHISRAELKAILETPMLDPLQELGRRAFLFSTFTNVTLNKNVSVNQKVIFAGTSDGKQACRPSIIAIMWKTYKAAFSYTDSCVFLRGRGGLRGRVLF